MDTDGVLTAISATTGAGAALLGLLSLGIGLSGFRALWRKRDLEPNDLIEFLGYLLWFLFGAAAVVVGASIFFGKGIE